MEEKRRLERKEERVQEEGSEEPVSFLTRRMREHSVIRLPQFQRARSRNDFKTKSFLCLYSLARF